MKIVKFSYPTVSDGLKTQEKTTVVIDSIQFVSFRFNLVHQCTTSELKLCLTGDLNLHAAAQKQVWLNSYITFVSYLL